MTQSPEDFIRAQTIPGAPPIVPEITLQLATEVTPLWHMTEEAQRKVADDLAAIVPDDGYLVTGVKEPVVGLTEAFQPIVGRPGLYRRNPTYRAAAA